MPAHVSRSEPRSESRLAALDGVRALAVAAVLADHAGIPGVSGGFIGVDVFFVLSGFLITSLLLDEHRRTGRADLPAFWARRARRLLPAALVMISAVVLTRGLLRPDAIHGLRIDALTAALWSSNWHFALQGTDYFATGGNASPLQHTWSLAVEEQFYVVWPLLLAAVWAGARGLRVRRGRLAVIALLGVAASTFLTSRLAAHASPGRVYFGTDTRAQELLIGAALAALLAPTWQWHQGSHRARRSPQSLSRNGVPAMLCMFGLVVLAFTAHSATGSPTEFRHGLMLSVSIASAALIAGVVLHTGTLPARLLSLPPLVALGRLSYGVYLWHWPVFEVMTGERTNMHGLRLAAARILITLLIAMASYALVERPARLMRVRPARLLPAAVVGVAATLAVILVATPAGPAQPASAAAPDVPPTAARQNLAHQAVVPLPSHHRTPAHLPVTVDVFGDSVAWTLAQYFPQSTQVSITDHAVLGCGVATTGPYRYFGAQYDEPSACQTWQTDWAAELQNDHPTEVLLWVGRWETMDRNFNGTWTHVGDPTYDAYLGSQLDTAIHLLSATGARVIVANEPYNQRGEQPDGSLYPEDDPTRVDDWNKIVAARVAAHPGTVLVDMNRKLGPDGRFTWNVDGVRVRSDGVHLSPAGADWLAPWLTAQLLDAAP